MNKPFLISILLAAGLSGLFSCNTGYRTDIQQLVSPSAIPYLKNSKLIMASSYDTSGGNNDKISLPNGGSVTILNAEGPGMIVRIWFSFDSCEHSSLRNVMMRIYWDGEENPSVEVPVSDFFGSAFRYQPFVSHFIGMTGGGFVAYFPMPFERSARIVLTNTSGKTLSEFRYSIEYQRFEAALESDVAYFHAQWRRSEKTDYDSNYVILQANGKGHLVGVVLNLQGSDTLTDLLEGDQVIFVDGEKRPSVQGTGLDDFLSGGGGFLYGEYFGPYAGLIVKDDSLGWVSAYRFHVPDPVPFKKKIRVSIEHGHKNQLVADFSSVAFWYQMEDHTSFSLLP